MAKHVQLFSALDLLISTHKKSSKCGDPTNITPWECCHLYSKSRSPIKVIKRYGEHLFIDKMAKYVKLFSTLELLISTHKKTSKCGDPTNITPWECCHLYSKSSSPIKLIKSYGEYLFLYKMAKYGQIFSVLDLFTTISKRPQNVENPFLCCYS